MQDTPKILTAYDGLASADSALCDLPRAGLPEKAIAQVMCVADVWMPPANELDASWNAHEAISSYPPAVVGVMALRRQAIERAVEAIHHAHDTAEKGKARLAELFPEWQIRTCAGADSPAWGVLKKENEWRPDLVIVGGGGYSLPVNLSFGNSIMGRVSQKIVTKAVGTVRVGRAPENRVRIRRACC